VPNLWLAALLGGLAIACSAASRKADLRKLAGNVLGQVLVTLGVAFIIADLCLVVWGGDPIPIPTPRACSSRCACGAWCYRLPARGVVLAVVAWVESCLYPAR
jgi:branched-chain amino acid transport system permease protein